MNNTQKYVASTTLDSPEWNNSTVIEGDVAEALTQLKQQDGKDIMVNGSATLVRGLLRDGLLDELRLFLHPVVLGSGDRLFTDGSGLVELALTDSHAYDNGVISLTYRPAAGSEPGASTRTAQ
jgi:dihydrofolate reductase